MKSKGPCGTREADILTAFVESHVGKVLEEFEDPSLALNLGRQINANEKYKGLSKEKDDLVDAQKQQNDETLKYAEMGYMSQKDRRKRSAEIETQGQAYRGAKKDIHTNMEQLEKTHLLMGLAPKRKHRNTSAAEATSFPTSPSVPVEQSLDEILSNAKISDATITKLKAVGVTLSSLRYLDMQALKQCEI